MAHQGSGVALRTGKRAHVGPGYGRTGVTYQAAFTDPTSIAGILGWWDPTLAAHSGASGDPIPDSSAAGNPQAGGTGIQSSASGINAKRSFSFDGSSACNTNHFFNTTQPISLAAIVKPTSTTAQYILGNEATTGAGLYIGAGPVWGLIGNTTLTGGTPDTNAHLVVAVINGASSSIWVDGTSVASGNIGSSTMAGGPICLGFGPSPSSFTHYTGLMGDCFWYGAALAAGDQANLHTWAKTKWNTP